MAENEKTIKVVDRRLFTSDGEVRDEVKAELEAPEEAPAAAEAAPQKEEAPEAAVASDPAFLRLLDMLAQTAALYLEGYPDPATGRRQVDLAGVRQIIDSLVALRNKTRGRLSFEETDALEGLVGELPLHCARMAAPPPRGGKTPAPPAGSRKG